MGRTYMSQKDSDHVSVTLATTKCCISKKNSTNVESIEEKIIGRAECSQ